MKELNTYDDNLGGKNLPDFRTENPFIVPTDYFEESSAQIKRICKLTQLIPDTPQVDSNLSQTYFDDLTNQITSRIMLEKLLPNSKDTGFTVPIDYFAHAQEEILTATKLDSLLAKEQGEGFVVEHEYFEALHAKIIQRTVAVDTTARDKKQTRTKVVSMQRWMKYSAAACLLCVLSIGAYFGLKSNPDQNNVAYANTATSELVLSNIPDDELIDYLAFNNDSDDLQYYVDYIDMHDHECDEDKCAKLKDEDLEAYINYML